MTVLCFLHSMAYVISHHTQFLQMLTGNRHDSDGNENGKKTICLDSKTRLTLRVHHAFFVHFFAVTAVLRRENA